MFRFLKRRPQSWVTPSGTTYDLYSEMARETHLLIAGSTGSGKSCAASGVMHSLLTLHSPAQAKFILIDPKMTELAQYKDLPHTMIYAYEHSDIIATLQQTIQVMESRLYEMQQAGLKQYNGPHIYVMIDELADIMLVLKRQAKPLLQRILQLGRAAGIHVIACTQVTLASVIPTEIKINFTGIVALKVPTRQMSRNMIDIAGCETFPDPPIDHKAYCFYRRGCLCDCWKLPLIEQSETNRLISWWTSKACIA